MNFKQTAIRAAITFVLVFGLVQLLFILINRWIVFPGQILLTIIAAGWAAYVVYQKSEGRRF